VEVADEEALIQISSIVVEDLLFTDIRGKGGVLKVVVVKVKLPEFVGQGNLNLRAPTLAKDARGHIEATVVVGQGTVLYRGRLGGLPKTVRGLDDQTLDLPGERIDIQLAILKEEGDTEGRHCNWGKVLEYELINPF
jgi:hypothetical protein